MSSKIGATLNWNISNLLYIEITSTGFFNIFCILCTKSRLLSAPLQERAISNIFFPSSYLYHTHITYLNQYPGDVGEPSFFKYGESSSGICKPSIYGESPYFLNGKSVQSSTLPPVLSITSPGRYIIAAILANVLQ